jgi:hypothetical protein
MHLSMMTLVIFPCQSSDVHETDERLKCAEGRRAPQLVSAAQTDRRRGSLIVVKSSQVHF